MLKKNKMKQYILESSKKAQRRHEHYTIFGSVDVFIKNPLPENVELGEVLSKLQKTIVGYKSAKKRSEKEQCHGNKNHYRCNI